MFFVFVPESLVRFRFGKPSRLFVIMSRTSPLYNIMLFVAKYFSFFGYRGERRR
jgi:hypothetical protein